tara:strand:- start:9689 stop:10420 length:732 start_codon:yes stop_codon:yes gene_type:complete
MKRSLDILLSLFGLIIVAPFVFTALILVWLEDRSSPVYIANRVGRNGREFKMIKIRTMIVNADSNGVDSTSSNDPRITRVGKFIRKYKIDELTQLINILFGEMSFVGPRPNVRRETDLYTPQEMRLLLMKPGLTDFASIVFSDESSILADFEDPDISYNQLIRPGKSRLGLFYVYNHNFLVDVFLIIITLINIFDRKRSLRLLSRLLSSLGASKELLQISSRKEPLKIMPPPGSDMIIKSRNT